MSDENAQQPPPIGPGESSIPHDLPGTPPAPRPWGFWSTIGFSLATIAVYLIAQVLAMVGFGILAAVSSSELFTAEDPASNGFLLSLLTILTTPVLVACCIIFALLRKGVALTDYLGLTWPGNRTALRWGAALLGLIVLSDSITVALGREIVPQVMIDWYESAGVRPLLWFAIIFAAPVGEEIFFRGFLFSGLQHSWLRNGGAILVTSTFWAAIHVQYDLYGMSVIFVAGIFLGLAKCKTGSLLLCMALHALMNLISTIEVEWVVLTGNA